MHHPQPRICVLGATFNTGNVGVTALAAGTIACILHRYPQAEIFLLDYGRESLPQPVEFRDTSIAI